MIYTWCDHIKTYCLTICQSLLNFDKLKKDTFTSSKTEKGNIHYLKKFIFDFDECGDDMG